MLAANSSEPGGNDVSSDGPQSLAVSSNLLNSISTALLNLEIYTIFSSGLLANTAGAAQVTLVTLTGSVLTPLPLAVSYLTSSATRLITQIVTLVTPVTSALGSLAGDYLSLLATVTTGTNTLLAQLAIGVTGGTPNSNVTINVATSSLAASLVQLLQSAASSVTALTTGNIAVTNTNSRAIYALVIAQIPTINLVAQVVGQASAILASLFPELSQTLSELADSLATSLLGFNNIIAEIAQAVQQGTNALNPVSTSLNTNVATLAASTQALVGTVPVANPGPKGGVISAGSSILTDAIAGVTTLITAVSGPLGPLAPIVLDALNSLGSTLQIVINTLTAIVAGILEAQQASNIFGILLNSIVSDFSTYISATSQSTGIVGDPVANVLYSSLFAVAPLISDTLNCMLNVTMVIFSDGDGITSAVNEMISTLTDNLQIDLKNINALVSLIVGGMPTGKLAPIAGSATTSTTFLQSANEAVNGLLITSVLSEPSDVVDKASSIIGVVYFQFLNPDNNNN